MNAILSRGHLHKHGSPTFCFFQMGLVFLVLTLLSVFPLSNALPDGSS